jgi:hypothetical protein
MARGYSRREWGRAKTETLQASLPDFCFFSAHPSLLGAIRANLRDPSLDFQKNDFAVHDFAKKGRRLFSNWRGETCF